MSGLQGGYIALVSGEGRKNTLFIRLIESNDEQSKKEGSQVTDLHSIAYG